MMIPVYDMETLSRMARADQQNQQNQQVQPADELPAEQRARIAEAKALADYATVSEWVFVSNVLEDSGLMFIGDKCETTWTLTGLYHFGQVEGVRRERERRRQKQIRQIERDLEGNPALLQLMREAVTAEPAAVQAATEALTARR